MKIAVLNNLYPPVPSGSSHFVYEFSKRFVELGHEVNVITVRHKPDLPDEETIDGVNVFRLPCVFLPEMRIAHNFKWMSLSLSPMNIRRIKKIIREREVQLLHQNGHFFDLAVATAIIKKQLKLPAVIHLHANALHNNPFYDKILKFGDSVVLKNIIIRHYDELVAADINLAEYAYDRYGWKNARVVPYGVDQPENVKDLDEAEIEKYDLKDKKLLVSLGHLHENRNRCDIIKAIPEVKKVFPNIKLVIIGETYYKYPLQLVKELGIEDSVVFTGAMKHDKALSFIKRSDLGVLWSNRSNPGLGIAQLETMSLSKPLLTTIRDNIIPGLELNDEEHVFVIQKNEHTNIARKIIKILDDKPLLDKVGKNGSKIVKQFYTWQAVCRNLETCFEEQIRNYS